MILLSNVMQCRGGNKGGKSRRLRGEDLERFLQTLDLGLAFGDPLCVRHHLHKQYRWLLCQINDL